MAENESKTNSSQFTLLYLLGKRLAKKNYFPKFLTIYPNALPVFS